MEDAKIGLIQFQISPPKTDIENNVVVSDYNQARVGVADGGGKKHANGGKRQSPAAFHWLALAVVAVRPVNLGGVASGRLGLRSGAHLFPGNLPRLPVTARSASCHVRVRVRAPSTALLPRLIPAPARRSVCLGC
jgi:hypothetical protein